MTSHRTIFLPGATGDSSFWFGAGECLPRSWEKRLLSWPGLGNQDPDPQINGFPDLVRLAAGQLTLPSIVIAQSMGGIVALLLALQCPELITHLVLVATSGGLDVAALGAADWRPEFLRCYPRTARWLLEDKVNLSNRLQEIDIPTLLLWGEVDPISPPAVGYRLAEEIRGAQLRIIPGGNHEMGVIMPNVVASHVLGFVSQSTEGNVGIDWH